MSVLLTFTSYVQEVYDLILHNIRSPTTHKNILPFFSTAQSAKNREYGGELGVVGISDSFLPII